MTYTRNTSTPKLDKNGQRRGRPALWKPHHAQAVLQKLISGQSLLSVCQDPELPDYSTVVRWYLEFDPAPIPDFATKYAQARRCQHERWGDEIIDLPEVANGGDMAAVALAKLKVDSRKWLLSKLRPELYGDRLQVTQSGGAAQIHIYLPGKPGAPGDGAKVIDGQLSQLPSDTDSSDSE